MIRQPNGYEIPEKLNFLLNIVVRQKGLDALQWLQMSTPSAAPSPNNRHEFLVALGLLGTPEPTNTAAPFPYSDQEFSVALGLLGTPERTNTAELFLVRRARLYMAHELGLVTMHGQKIGPLRQIGALFQATQRFLQASQQLSYEAYSVIDEEGEGTSNSTIQLIAQIGASCELLETDLANLYCPWHQAVLALRAPGGWSARSLPVFHFPDEETRGAPKKRPRNSFIADLAHFFERIAGKKNGDKLAFIRAAIEPFGYSRTIVTDAAIKGVLRRTHLADEQDDASN